MAWLPRFLLSNARLPAFAAHQLRPELGHLSWPKPSASWHSRTSAWWCVRAPIIAPQKLQLSLWVWPRWPCRRFCLPSTAWRARHAGEQPVHANNRCRVLRARTRWLTAKGDVRVHEISRQERRVLENFHHATETSEHAVPCHYHETSTDAPSSPSPEKHPYWAPRTTPSVQKRTTLWREDEWHPRTYIALRWKR